MSPVERVTPTSAGGVRPGSATARPTARAPTRPDLTSLHVEGCDRRSSSRSRRHSVSRNGAVARRNHRWNATRSRRTGAERREQHRPTAMQQRPEPGHVDAEHCGRGHVARLELIDECDRRSLVPRECAEQCV